MKPFPRLPNRSTRRSLWLGVVCAFFACTSLLAQEIEGNNGNKHPLEPALERAHEGLKLIEETVADYTATIIKRERINGALKEHEAVAKVDAVCRRLGISNGTFYNWRSKYDGLEVNEAKRLREFESENNKLKKLLAESALHIEALKDVVSKKW